MAGDAVEILSGMRRAILEGDEDEAVRGAEAAFDSGLPAREVMGSGLVAAMEEVGSLYERKEYFVPEVLLSARAMKACLEAVKPRLRAGNVEPAGRVVIGTAAGDVHDIGKNIVALTLEGAGFEVFDAGADVPAPDFLEAARENRADVLAMSALLTTTRRSMVEVLGLLEKSGARGRLKVLIGGAAVSERFASEIGADGYGSDAVEAVRVTRRLAGLR